MNQPAFILFGHGARDSQWADPLRRIQAAILERDPGRVVELAFLEFLEPGLEACVDKMVAAGIREIQVVPMFMAQSGHLKRDLPLQVAAVQQRHPEIKLQVTGAVGEAPQVIAAMAGYVLSLN